jgi:hypothetical protein
MPEKWDVSAEIRAEQKAALEKMSFKQKVAYYWEYYRFHALIALAVLAVGINIVSFVINQKPYSFYGLMLNAFELDGASLQGAFSDFAGLDEQKTACFIDTQSYLNIDELDQYNIASIQRILALISAGDLDVIVSDGPTFIYLAEGEMLMDLRAVLSAEEITRYEEYFFYIDQAAIERRNNDENLVIDVNPAVKSPEEKVSELEERRDPTQMENPVPVGIFVNETAFIKKSGAYPNYTPVYGIAVSSQRLETAKQYLEFLFTKNT